MGIINAKNVNEVVTDAIVKVRPEEVSKPTQLRGELNPSPDVRVILTRALENKDHMMLENALKQKPMPAAKELQQTLEMAAAQTTMLLI